MCFIRSKFLFHLLLQMHVLRIVMTAVKHTVRPQVHAASAIVGTMGPLASRIHVSRIAMIRVNRIASQTAHVLSAMLAITDRAANLV
jgi:hypothetical protein